MRQLFQNNDVSCERRNHHIIWICVCDGMTLQLLLTHTTTLFEVLWIGSKSRFVIKLGSSGPALALSLLFFIFLFYKLYFLRFKLLISLNFKFCFILSVLLYFQCICLSNFSILSLLSYFNNYQIQTN